MRIQSSYHLCAISLAYAAVLPGLDGIAGLSGVLGGIAPFSPAPAPAPAPEPIALPAPVSAPAPVLTTPVPDSAPVSALGPAPLPAANIIPPPPSTRPDLPDLNTPSPVLNRPDLPLGGGPGPSSPSIIPPGILPPGGQTTAPFKIYVIPSQFTPFEYSFKNSYYGPYDEPAWLDADGALVPNSRMAGTFTTVEPGGYLLSLSQPTPAYFTASLYDLLTWYSPVTFPYRLENIDDLDFVSGRFYLGSSGAGLGNGLPAGFGTTNPKLSYTNQAFQTPDKLANFCAVA